MANIDLTPKKAEEFLDYDKKYVDTQIKSLQNQLWIC